MKHGTPLASTQEREQLTRAILEAPIEMNHAHVAQMVGAHRELVRRIRYGMVNETLCPDLPRLDLATGNRKCTGCDHYISKRRTLVDPFTGITTEKKGRCSLGIPEAWDVLYGRGCGAYVEAKA